MLLALLALGLAAVLAVSGTAKLLDLRGAAATLRGFDVPERLVPAAAVGLPLAELGLAAALVPLATARVASVAASSLFLVFTIATAVTLLRGERPECGCFGRLRSRPIGWTTVARAGGLAAVAAFLAVAGSGDGVSVLAGRPVAWLAAATGGQSVLLVAVLRRHGRTLARLDELESAPVDVELARGAHAPEFTLPDLSGERVSLASLTGQRRPTLLVFGHPGCGPCTALLPELARWQKEHARRVTVVLVTQGDDEVNRAHAEEHGLELVLLDADREVAAAYGAQGTPAAVLVSTEGRIAAPMRYGVDAVKALLVQTLARERRPARPAILAAAASGAAATPALAARADDEDDAIRALKRILRAHDPALRRETQRLLAGTRQLFATPGSAAVTFELLAAIALVKRELERAKEQIDAVPVPDYRPGERGARIAKSHASAHLALLVQVLNRYASAAKAKSVAERERHFDEITRLTTEAEKRRRLASKKLGCARKLEDC